MGCGNTNTCFIPSASMAPRQASPIFWCRLKRASNPSARICPRLPRRTHPHVPHLFDALTEKGKRNPILAAEKTVMNYLARKSDLENRKTLGKMRMDFIFELSVTTDERACEVCTSMKGKRFSMDQAPLLPIEDCQSDFCRCGYYSHPIK